jgi:hypothetical protein
VQLLVGQDVLRKNWARPAHSYCATYAPERLPYGFPNPGPINVQPRIRGAGILGRTLQMSAQRGAVTLPRRQFILGAAALRQAFAESAIKSSVLWMPART